MSVTTGQESVGSEVWRRSGMKPMFSSIQYIFVQAAQWNLPQANITLYNVIERLKIENENRECFTEKTVEVGIENQYL
jgi:hypothetical protein